MSPLAIGTDLPSATSGTVERASRLVLDALRRCRRATTRPVASARVRNLIARVEKDRARPAQQIITLLRDAAERGASRDSVEAPVRALLAEIASWYDVGAPVRDEQLLELIRRETRRQSAGDRAELELMHARTPKAIGDAIDALDAHLVALEDLSAALHARQVAS